MVGQKLLHNPQSRSIAVTRVNAHQRRSELTRSRGRFYSGTDPRGRNPQWVFHMYIPSSPALRVHAVEPWTRVRRVGTPGPSSWST